MGQKIVTLPLTDEKVQDLKAGDRVLLNGDVYAARDAAHKRLMDRIEANEELPINLEGEVIYYVGPTPAKPGQVIGSAGPTTSGRMDRYTPKLLSLGLKGMIGKGYRNEEVKAAIQKYNAIYFGAIGGSGALLSKKIQAETVVAYEDLGPEAVRRLTIKDFPVTVINDCYGNDLYQQGSDAYKGRQT
ncbi:Fe-S-containing hydro-lyase [Salicibibacter cibarius]|uniref:Fe-S-containing hydro-lyase n=1 Tax=Salicibibacter cibarius TaxID=2743000 RepID=A0A7T7CC11_9BACI|nr:Fe-S-containing hydro-lyase [Salicibibacter cibarius]QQK76458.1 Fe-S-containing hydro-lyase [Salicibibacter cibarius]